MDHIVVREPETDKLQEIIAEINSLPANDKAQLLSALLGGKDAGMSVIFGNGNNHVLSADVVVQINSADTSTVQAIVDAIASRIEKRS